MPLEDNRIKKGGNIKRRVRTGVRKEKAIKKVSGKQQEKGGIKER